jgi:hypothetical protein
LCCVLIEFFLKYTDFVMSVDPGLPIASKGTRGKD